MREDLHEENEAVHVAVREEWVVLHEAAKRLHISPRAVQLRAEKGKLRRERREGRVLFAVPVHEGIREAVHEENAELHAESEAVHEAPTQTSTDYVTHLEAEIVFLREQLQQRDVADSEMRRLMLQDKHELNRLREQLAIVAAPVENTGSDIVSPPDENSVQSAPNLDSTANQPSETPDGPQKGTGESGRAWWQRIFGRGA